MLLREWASLRACRICRRCGRWDISSRTGRWRAGKEVLEEAKTFRAEETAVRRDDLPRHGVCAVGLEYGAWFV